MFRDSLTFDFFRFYIFSSRSGSIVRRIARIAVTALCVSVASLVIVMSVMNALNKNVEERTLAIDPHLVITSSSPQKDDKLFLESHPAVNKIKSNSQWQIFSIDSQEVIIRTIEGRFRGANARGLSRDGLQFIFSAVSKAQGREIEINVNLEPGEVVIGIDLAHSLGVFEGDSLVVVPIEGLLLPLGERPPLDRIRIKKIVSTNLAEVDSQGLFYLQNETLKTISRNQSKKSEIHIWTDNPHRVDSIKNSFNQEADLRVTTWKERNASLFHALLLEKLVIGLFLGIASLLASFALLSAIGLLISQKSRDIGILQSIGMSKSRIEKLFTHLGLILSAIGVGTGLIIGIIVSAYLEFYPLRILPDIYYDTEIPAKLNWFFVFSIIGIASLISFLGMKISSRSIVSLDPTECLRK